jgi:hypothetical protein
VDGKELSIYEVVIEQTLTAVIANEMHKDR